MDVGRPFCFLARLAAKAAQRPPFNSGAYGQSNLFLPRHFAACLSLALDNLSVKPLGGVISPNTGEEKPPALVHCREPKLVWARNEAQRKRSCNTMERHSFFPARRSAPLRGKTAVYRTAPPHCLSRLKHQLPISH